jgi:hypothetical protein
MADAVETYYVDGGGEHPNLEAASLVAEAEAARKDVAVDVWKVTRTKVRCFKREVSITETDLTATPPA